MISLNGDNATSDGSGVTISGGLVTIARRRHLPGDRLARRRAARGRQQGPGTVDLVLSDARVASSTSSPLTILSAAAVNLTLADGTDNSLSDASIYTGTSGAVVPDAALFSAVDLTIRGSGALTVRGNAHHGINGQRGLTIASGTPLPSVADDDSVRATDGLRIIDRPLTVDAGRGWAEGHECRGRPPGSVSIEGAAP